MSELATIYRRPVEILQNLLRFDTTNPPGNEGPCIAYIGELLRAAGIEYVLAAKTPERPNLVARLKGRGAAPPLLLYGHVDVVTTQDQRWSHPPFSGEIAEGCVWGRGALDMKGGLAMMLAAFLRAKAESLDLPGDVILAALSDEEHGGDYGAKYLVAERAELFQGARYALGELGGFPFYFRGKRFYPIQISEKQTCRFKAVMRGPGGHASMPVRGGAMAKLGRLLQRLDQRRLPVHITPPARLFFEAMASALTPPDDDVIRRLLDPAQADKALDELGEEGRMFDAMLHNTVSPTIVRGGHKVNVIPTEVTLELDGRVLPGYDEKDMARELRELVGEEVELEMVRWDRGPAEPDMGLFDVLATALREADPEGVPIPYLLTATTDARSFSELGIQTYGFLPMNLPEGMDVLRMAHAADERIPLEAVHFGTETIYRVLQRFGTA